MKQSLLKRQKIFFRSKFETSKKSLSNQYYIAETDSIYQESIIQSDKKLTIIPAKTIFKNHFSRILLLKINGEIKSVIVSMQHEEQSLSDKFSGAIIITNLNGAYITGYKIDNGIVKYQIANKKISNKTHSSKSDEGGCLYHETTNPECYFCITNALNEVVIIAEKDTNQGLDPMNGGGGGDPNPVLQDPGDGFPPGGGNNNNSCPLGKVKDANTGKCVCPEGYVEDVNGNCVDKTPCDYINSQINDNNVKQKIETLKDSTGIKHETGYVQNRDGTFTKLNATVITSTGNYTLRITGNKNDITGLKETKDYRDDYTEYLDDKGNEKGFLHFLKDHIKVTGIELYKIKDNGTIKKKSLNINGRVESEPCE